MSGATHPLGSVAPTLARLPRPCVRRRLVVRAPRGVRWPWSACRSCGPPCGRQGVGSRSATMPTSRSVPATCSPTHHPLLGAWSSGSLDLETPINNLGPTQLDLLAPFTRFTPMGGTAIAVALINIAAIVTVAWLVAPDRRWAGGAAGDVRGRPADVDDGVGDADHPAPAPGDDPALPVPAGRGLGGDGGRPVGDRGRCRRRQPGRPDAPLVSGARGGAGGADGRRSGGRLAGRHGNGRAPAVRRRRPCWRACCGSRPSIDQFAGYGNLGHVLFGSGDAGRAGFVDGRPDRRRHARVAVHVPAPRLSRVRRRGAVRARCGSRSCSGWRWASRSAGSPS